jgi:hypothetical protein
VSPHHQKWLDGHDWIDHFNVLDFDISLPWVFVHFGLNPVLELDVALTK